CWGQKMIIKRRMVLVALFLIMPLTAWIYNENLKTEEQKFFEEKIQDIQKFQKPINQLTNFSWTRGCLHLNGYGESNSPPYFIIKGTEAEYINKAQLIGQDYTYTESRDFLFNSDGWRIIFEDQEH